MERSPARTRTRGVGQLELVGEEIAELDDASQEQREDDRDQGELDEGLGAFGTESVRNS
jgi:hypothetical protein